MGKNKTVNVKSSLGKALVRSRFNKGNRELDSNEKWVGIKRSNFFKEKIIFSYLVTYFKYY